MSVRVRSPWDHPWDGSYLPAWACHYHHAFVALHPFWKRPWVVAVGLGEVARACGSSPFARFAQALWDASYRETDADPALVRRSRKVMDRLDLIPRADRWPNAAMIPDFCRMLRALGVETLRMRDNLAKTEAAVPLAPINAGSGAVHAEAVDAHAPAMFAPNHRLIATTQTMCDCQLSVVAMTGAVHAALGSPVPLEGFPATAATSDCWLNQAGNYTPDWLREIPDAA